MTKNINNDAGMTVGKPFWPFCPSVFKHVSMFLLSDCTEQIHKSNNDKGPDHSDVDTNDWSGSHVDFILSCRSEACQ